MTKDFTAEKLYPWNRCIPEERRDDWELLTFNPDDFFGTALLFRHKKHSTYAVGTVGECSNSDFFCEIPIRDEIFFAARQTEDTWILLVYDGDIEYMMRLRLNAGRRPEVLNTEILGSEVRRCMVNRQGHILIGYDNSCYFSDAYGFDSVPVADLSIESAGAGQNGTILPLLEWYDAEGNLIHMFSDNRNTVITELNIDSEDRALITVDLADPIIRLAPGDISYIDKNCLFGTVIEGLTEAENHSGYLISFSNGREILHDEQELPYRSFSMPSTMWLESGASGPVPCRVSCGKKENLPLDGYSCRGNTVLIEEDGWIYRLLL